MNDFTPEQFNEAMASLLAGYEYESILADKKYFDCYNDLNQLMPIAWKHGVDLDQELDGSWSAKAYIKKDRPSAGVLDIIDDDPVEAIRQCLWQIYKEQK